MTAPNPQNTHNPYIPQSAQMLQSGDCYKLASAPDEYYIEVVAVDLPNAEYQARFWDGDLVEKKLPLRGTMQELRNGNFVRLDPIETEFIP
jgi:hypothetical protein